MRKTPRNKVRRQTRKETQRGGQTSSKTNYTFYFAGYDPTDPDYIRIPSFFYRYTNLVNPDTSSSCSAAYATSWGCPGPRTRATIPWMRDTICGADDML